MMPVMKIVEHEGRRFTVRSTLGGDCRLAMLLAFIRSSVDQAGGEVNPDAREVADWLTEEVGRTSTRTVSQLLRQLVRAGDPHRPAGRQLVVLRADAGPAGHDRCHQRAAASPGSASRLHPTRRPECKPDASRLRLRTQLAYQRHTARPTSRLRLRMQVRCR